MLFSKQCDRLAAPLMESRLAFVPQKDVTEENGARARYFSDPMIDIDERIAPRTHHRVRVPKHGSVIRRVWYLRRRYPTIPSMMCKSDVRGAFKLLRISIRGFGPYGSTVLGIHDFISFLVFWVETVACLMGIDFYDAFTVGIGFYTITPARYGPRWICII